MKKGKIHSGHTLHSYQQCFSWESPELEKSVFDSELWSWSWDVNANGRLYVCIRILKEDVPGIRPRYEFGSEHPPSASPLRLSFCNQRFLDYTFT